MKIDWEDIERLKRFRKNIEGCINCSRYRDIDGQKFCKYKYETDEYRFLDIYNVDHEVPSWCPEKDRIIDYVVYTLSQIREEARRVNKIEGRSWKLNADEFIKTLAGEDV